MSRIRASIRFVTLLRWRRGNLTMRITSVGVHCLTEGYFLVSKSLRAACSYGQAGPVRAYEA
jgi:hypothetical protein